MKFSSILKDPSDRKKYFAIFSLQVAHDLPNALTSTMAPTLFIKQFGMPLEYLGLFFLPFVVTAFKWTWAPVVDNVGSDQFGRRKSWLLPLTFCVAAAYIAIGLVEPGLETLYFIISLLIVKQVFYSTQEIAADAYVIENLKASERGFGSSVVWIGKEFGQVIGFAGLLFVADQYGWRQAFFLAAALFIAFNTPALLRKEPARKAVKESQRANVFSFFKSGLNWRIISIVFVVAFTVQMPVTIIGPFLGDKGLTLSEIGVVLGIAASLGAIISLAIASAVISRIGPKRLAIAMVFIAPFAAPGFLWAASQESVTPQIVVLLILWATICTAPIRMAVYAARIGWTSKNQVGTDMTIQQSVWFLGYVFSGVFSGILAANVGWTAFFIVNIVLVTAALLYFIRFHDPIETAVNAMRADTVDPE
ncbi:MAG: MFS transporter [Pseudomonadota bacterium]